MSKSQLTKGENSRQNDKAEQLSESQKLEAVRAPERARTPAGESTRTGERAVAVCVAVCVHTGVYNAGVSIRALARVQPPHRRSHPTPARV